MADGVTIAKVAKNSLEEIRVTFCEFKGHKLIDVRTFASFDGSESEKRATKKGISLRLDKLDDLIGALQDAAAFLKGDAHV